MNNLIFGQASHAFHFLSSLPFYFFLPFFFIFIPDFSLFFLSFPCPILTKIGMQKLGVAHPLNRKAWVTPWDANSWPLNSYMVFFNFFMEFKEMAWKLKRITSRKTLPLLRKNITPSYGAWDKREGVKNQESMILWTLPYQRKYMASHLLFGIQIPSKRTLPPLPCPISQAPSYVMRN